jgi:TonB family protein
MESSWPLRSALLFSVAFATAVQGAFTPARYRDGALPQIQIRAVGGGEVFLDVDVSDAGAVGGISVLRATSPFTDAVVAAVRGWHFAPAEEEVEPEPGKPVDLERRKPAESTVLVAAMFRPPTINTPTFGEVPRDVASPAKETPFPIVTATPSYPPDALFDGVALIEVLVDSDGRVGAAKAIRSAPPFDEPALEAARRWVFRPARLHGVPVATLAYIVFAFRQPVTVRDSGA